MLGMFMKNGQKLKVQKLSKITLKNRLCFYQYSKNIFNEFKNGLDGQDDTTFKGPLNEWRSG